MDSSKKPRIRISLNVDEEIHALLKKMSKVEQKPISRIFDEVFCSIVEPYKFPTPEEWKDEQGDRAYQQIEDQYNFEPPEPEFDHEMSRILKKIPEAKNDDERNKAYAEMHDLIESRKEKDEYRKRWIKHCSK